MTIEQAADFLRTEPPSGWALGLETVECLLGELGNPHIGLEYVHVAGTNGKGSTCAFISSILEKAGYKTGLFISPAISEINEQIQICGKKITNEEMAALATEIEAASRRVEKACGRRPSSFEKLTAMAFMHFKNHKCHIVVLETGLGGRLDATNIVKSCRVAVITNIGLDHMEFLGNSIELIAAEKAGIIKSGCTTVLYAQSGTVENVVRKTCDALNAGLVVADGSRAKIKSAAPEGTVFSYDCYEDLKIGLGGLHQVKNAVTAIEAVKALRQKGFEIGDEAIKSGLSSAFWPGRFELLGKNPYIIVDGAHNPQSAKALVESLSAVFPGRKITFIFGILSDKDYRSVILQSLPVAKRFYTISPPSDRALTPVELAENIGMYTHIPAEAFAGITQALDTAISEASPEDIICIFGSLYQVGEIRKYFGRDKY